jgi:hypothetical protein
MEPDDRKTVAISLAPDWWKPKKYRCRHGHEFEARSPLTISFGVDQSEARTGAICHVCYANDLRERFGGVEEVASK